MIFWRSRRLSLSSSLSVEQRARASASCSSRRVLVSCSAALSCCCSYRGRRAQRDIYIYCMTDETSSYQSEFVGDSDQIFAGRLTLFIYVSLAAAALKVYRPLTFVCICTYGVINTVRNSLMTCYQLLLLLIFEETFIKKLVSVPLLFNGQNITSSHNFLLKT